MRSSRRRSAHVGTVGAATLPPPEPPRPPLDGNRLRRLLAAPPKTFKFPTAFTVLALVLAPRVDRVVLRSRRDVQTKDATARRCRAPTTSSRPAPRSPPAATALVVDSPGETGVAPADARRRRAPRSPARASNCVDTSFTYRFKQLWNAPPNGLYGVEASNGFVGPWEGGFLYGSAAIFLFVLAVGAFITVTMKTEAIQTGIGRLAASVPPQRLDADRDPDGRLRDRRDVYGMWEETLGFFVLLVPLTLALRYDRMVAAAIIFLGAGSGVIGSTVNPFSTGVASDAAGISIGDGIGLRIALWVVSSRSRSRYVIWYARRVNNDPSKSVVGVSAARRGRRREASSATSRSSPAARRSCSSSSARTFVTMIYGFIPWNDLWQEGFGKRLPAADVRGLLLPRGRRRSSS